MPGESESDGLPPRRLPEWKVVHAPRVAVRSAPDTKASLAGSKMEGETVTAEAEEGGWIRLAAESTSGARWMLIDGAEVGLGKLLERVPPPNTHLTLRFSHPETGRPLCEVQSVMSATVGTLKAAVQQQCGLRARSLVLARGRQVQRADA